MVEVLTKFDPYAMVHPKTPKDYSALLDEAISEADNLKEHLRALTARLEKDQNDKH
jgi:hypothetical protein